MNKNHKSKILNIILIFLIFSLVGTVYYTFVYKVAQQKKVDEEAGLALEQSQLVTPETPIIKEEPSETPSPEPSPTPSQKVIREEFVKLREQFNNDDIIGYLNIEGTTIDYPIVQSTDNIFYLDKDINKKPEQAGWPFLDYENSIEREDLSSIIYAHNMKADYMFHAIRNYSKKDFYDNHKYITFNNIFEDNTWEIFSYMVTTTDFNYIQVIFPTVDAYYNLAKSIKEKSSYDTGVTISPDDRILLLSTCADGSPSSTRRLVLAAKLVKNQ